MNVVRSLGGLQSRKREEGRKKDREGEVKEGRDSLGLDG